MSLYLVTYQISLVYSPRASGDEPIPRAGPPEGLRFAPRERG